MTSNLEENAFGGVTSKPIPFGVVKLYNYKDSDK
jgi:hypothetical protein